MGRTNEAIHSAKEALHTEIYTAESSKMWHCYSSPDLLLASDRHYFSTPLKKFLESIPSTWQRWLIRVRTASTRRAPVRASKRWLLVPKNFDQIHAWHSRFLLQTTKNHRSIPDMWNSSMVNPVARRHPTVIFDFQTANAFLGILYPLDSCTNLYQGLLCLGRQV